MMSITHSYINIESDTSRIGKFITYENFSKFVTFSRDKRKKKIKKAGGGFGAVYLAKFNGREVCVKVNHHTKNFGDWYNRDLCKSFEKEIRNYDKLQEGICSHQNIIKMLGHSRKMTKTGNRKYFIILELARYGSLDDYFFNRKKAKKEKRLEFNKEFNQNKAEKEEETRIEFSYNLIEALCFLKENGMIHRDVKPGNILIIEGKNGCKYAKLGDFGSTRMEWTVHNTHAAYSPKYCPPECNLCKPRTCFNSDVFSLGIVLFEIWYGKVAENPMNTKLQNFVYPKDAREEFVKLFGSCIKKNEHSRLIIEDVRSRFLQIPIVKKYFDKKKQVAKSLKSGLFVENDGLKDPENIRMLKGNITRLDKAIEHEPNDWNTYFSRGVEKIVLSGYSGYYSKPSQTTLLKDALVDIDISIEKNTKKEKNWNDCFFYRGVSRYLLDEFEIAVRNFNKVLSADPKFEDKRLFFYRGESYRRIGEYDNAIKDFKSFANVQCKNCKCECNSTKETPFGVKETLFGFEVCDYFLDGYSKIEKPINGEMCSSFEMMKEFNNVINYLLKKKNQFNSTKDWIKLSKIAIRMGTLNERLFKFEKALIDYENALTYYIRGIKSDGKKSHAFKLTNYYHEIMKRKNYVNFRLGVSKYLFSDFESAIKYFNKVLIIFCKYEDQRLYFYRGESHRKIGEYCFAIKDLETFVKNCDGREKFLERVIEAKFGLQVCYYFEECSKIEKQISDEMCIKMIKEFSELINSLMKKKNKSAEFWSRISRITLRMGTLYERLFEYEKASENYGDALKYSKASGFNKFTKEIIHRKNNVNLFCAGLEYEELNKKIKAFENIIKFCGKSSSCCESDFLQLKLHALCECGITWSKHKHIKNYKENAKKYFIKVINSNAVDFRVDFLKFKTFYHCGVMNYYCNDYGSSIKNFNRVVCYYNKGMEKAIENHLIMKKCDDIVIDVSKKRGISLYYYKSSKLMKTERRIQLGNALIDLDFAVQKQENCSFKDPELYFFRGRVKKYLKKVGYVEDFKMASNYHNYNLVKGKSSKILSKKHYIICEIELIRLGERKLGEYFTP